jgi:hypothetical protein
MKTKILLINCILLFVFCTLANATEKIYMPFFELINVHPDYQYSTARLFKNYVDEQKKYTLIIPAKPDSSITQPSIEKIRETAKSLNCQYFIIGDMNRIGETVIISFAMYNTENSEQIWHDRLKAASPDDIDPILQKLSRTLGSKNNAVEDGSIYSVTDYESGELKQVRANNAFGVSLGGALLFSKPLSNDPFSAGGGVFWYYDAREILYEVDAKIYFLGNNYLGHVSINTYHPFFAESNTPFLGGGLGIGFNTIDKSLFYPNNKEPWDNYGTYTGSGLVLYLGGGYIIGRTSNVGLRAHLQYFIATYKLNNPEKTLPHGLLLNMELYFGK